MNTRSLRAFLRFASLCTLGTGLSGPVEADTFGTGLNQFTIDFVTIGNPGNGNSGASPDGGVSYVYRMGVYEISQDQIDKAKAAEVVGLAALTAGAWTGQRPAANVTWYEAALFVNWLNTSQGHQAAYQINSLATSLTPWSSVQAWQLNGENLFRHKDAYYFLPNDDEWYKAAFHKNDGVTANYWNYATASNSQPTAVSSGTAAGTAVYTNDFPFLTGPAGVGESGGLSAYGTRGQNGNVWEWMESAGDRLNDSGSESRVVRGMGWDFTESSMSRFIREEFAPDYAGTGEFFPSIGSDDIGFRVASVPEPSSAFLLSGTALGLLLRRRRASTSFDLSGRL